MNLLEVKNLCKQYNNFSLQDISFSLPAGYIMGYIGQNGAGKTTTLNLITHLTRASSGSVFLDGMEFDQNPIAYRNAIGFIGDSSYFPEEMTILDIRGILKDFYASFRPGEFDRYISTWKLPVKDKVKNLSRGMRVKLMFAAVLSRDTKLLVLDEATNGLDPVMRREVLALLQDYIRDGSRSVIFSTHILADLEQIADFIFFINDGRKVFWEAKEDITEKYLLVKGGPSDLTPQLKTALKGIEKNDFGFEALYPTESSMILPPSLLTARPSIDQIIVHLIEEMR